MNKDGKVKKVHTFTVWEDVIEPLRGYCLTQKVSLSSKIEELIIQELKRLKILK